MSKKEKTISKETYKLWEKKIIDEYYSTKKKTTPIIPTNKNPSHLKQVKFILFLDINNIYKKVSSKKVKVSRLPPKQKLDIYHIGTKQLDNVSYGYDKEDKEFKYPALDVGGNSVFRSKIKTSYKTKLNFRLTKQTDSKEVSKLIYNEWLKLLGKSKIHGVKVNDIQLWVESVKELIDEGEFIILRFFKLPPIHRIVVTQSDIRKLTGTYYERIYGMSDETYAKESNNKSYYTIVEKHFVNPNINKQNLMNEYISYKSMNTKKKKNKKRLSTRK